MEIIITALLQSIARPHPDGYNLHRDYPKRRRSSWWLP